MSQVLILNERDVRDLVDFDDLMAALSQCFAAISSPESAITPKRGALVIPGSGSLLTMPAYVPEKALAVKLVTIFPGNRDLPSHQALITLMSPGTGEVVAILDGTHITATRTAGAAVLAAQLLARPDSRVMTILGAGVQGMWHLEMMTRVFNLERIFIASRRQERARQLADRHPMAHAVENADEAVRQSDIVCLCSHAHQPLISPEQLRPGQHISSVGYAPPSGELAPEIAADNPLFVESRTAFAPPPAGCSELAGLNPESGTELGELILNKKPGRQSPTDITVYKAMGHACEDLFVANMVYRKAVEQAKGQTVML